MIDLQSMHRWFHEAFGHAPQTVADAGGRVNIIGEHVDYVGGLVMPFALSLRAWVAMRKRNDGVFNVQSREHPRQGTWQNYVLGPLRDVKDAAFGADIFVASDVPLGGGLSSSAALEIATLAAFTKGLAPLPMAQIAQKAEREVCGVPCGIMDQLASALGADEGAQCIDCGALTWRTVPLAASLRFVVVDSGVKHALGNSEYRKRQEEHAAGDPRRVRHVQTEIARVREAELAFARNDFAALGALLYASHASLRDDYEVSCKELDLIVEASREIPNVHGARMVGGGFGGNALIVAGRELSMPALAGAVEKALGRHTTVREVFAGPAPRTHDSLANA